MRGTEEIAWFAGSGPANLDPASAKGLFIPAGSGHEPRFVFKSDARQDRTLYSYNLKRDSWGEVQTIPGTHPVDMFALLEGHIFTMDNRGGIYIGDRQIYGGGAPKNDLDSLLLVRKESKDNTIFLCGSVGRDTYDPDKGRWSYVEYDFLINGESID